MRTDVFCAISVRSRFESRVIPHARIHWIVKIDSFELDCQLILNWSDIGFPLRTARIDVIKVQNKRMVEKKLMILQLRVKLRLILDFWSFCGLKLEGDSLCGYGNEWELFLRFITNFFSCTNRYMLYAVSHHKWTKLPNLMYSIFI